MKPPTTLLLLLLLLAAGAAFSSAARDLDAEITSSSKHRGGQPGRGVPGFVPDPPSFFGAPGGGKFGIPDFRGWGNYGGGYGYGSGGPTGGSGWHGVVRPSVVCSEKGPCYKKKLTCPAKCFTSYTRSGKGYGGGGGGGGCTMDCKKCVSYC
ncbi:glycine-rich protein 2-like [Phoenix dactylifera]|uniref:Glycine-rich protein 2-like n=1 Tax=Phoenix dactylifera TaxID=42345 RepID=A0A8B7CDQ8_PHODC|nr:glycine-rich protein 2-like [Phoenix dactylifera]